MTSITANELHAIHIQDLDACAAKSAEQLIKQGWTADPSTYDIGAFPGDLEAAQDINGMAFDRDEVREHEARIRAHLAKMLG
jgi:hypothetical protein